MLHLKNSSMTINDFEENEPWKLKPYVYKESCAVMILFYVPWCPHCQMFIPIWEQLGMSFPDIKLYKMNMDTEKNSKYNKIINDSKKSKFKIETFPTIIGFRNGNSVGKYEGDRSLKDLIEKAMCLCCTKSKENCDSKCGFI